MSDINEHEVINIEIPKKKRGRPKGTKNPPKEKEPEVRDPNKPASYYGKYKSQYKYDIERKANDPEYKAKKYSKVNERNKFRYQNDEEFRLKRKQQNSERRKKLEEAYKFWLENNQNIG